MSNNQTINLTDLAPEDRALFDALFRVAAASWPRRDESGEETIIEAIQELIAARARIAELERENAESRQVVSVAASELPDHHTAVWLHERARALLANPSPPETTDTP